MLLLNTYVVGTPLKIDHRAILEGELGHFARDLVDMDVSKDL